MENARVFFSAFVMLLVVMSVFTGAEEINIIKNGETTSSQVSHKQDDMELDIQLCGCRVLRNTSGEITGKVCGCTVVDLSKGDFLLVGCAMMGLVALSKKWQ